MNIFDEQKKACSFIEKTIKENNLDLEYLYAFTHDKKDKAILLLHTDNLNALIDALIKNEIVIVPPEEVYNL